MTPESNMHVRYLLVSYYNFFILSPFFYIQHPMFLPVSCIDQKLLLSITKKKKKASKYQAKTGIKIQVS